jgi:hypothetical protein
VVSWSNRLIHSSVSEISKFLIRTNQPFFWPAAGPMP